MCENYLIPKEKLIEGIQLCRQKSLELLEEANTLVNNHGSTKVALGLLTFSLEEFGKSLLLEKLEKNGENMIPKNIFGQGKPEKPNAHIKKINRALDELPEKLRKVVHGIGHKKPDASMGENVLLIVSGPPDFATRMRLFFVGWNEKNNDWIRYNIPPRKELSEFIHEVSQFLREYFESNSIIK